ncbi:MAG: DUF6531 domain-containing protein [Actinomycetota bacterium]|nr:DUF6531 domain-containing protein [Actinomycetota bacterium]
MNVPSESPSGTARCLLVFALLFCLSSLLPVAAASAEAPTEAEVTAALQAGFAAHQQQQRQREEWLSTPAAIQEREASRHAFADLGPAEAEELLRSRFGEVLEALNQDPARYLSDAKLESPLGLDAATVTSEGETTLLESSVPVRAPDEDEVLRKVDVSLVRTSEGWEPVNPLVELEIGELAEEGVEVGDGGVAITQAGAEESVARPLGDKNIFYGEVSAAANTDLLVSPTSTGVELFNLLRSVDSPETLRFHIDMPAGASLRVNASGAGEVIGADGEPLMLIAKPMAIDAQGTEVPVAMSAEGDSIVLGLNHRDEDLAYPILVDPELLYQDWGWWYGNQHLAGLGAFGWAPDPSPWWIHHGTQSTAFPGYEGKGLFISTEPGNLGGDQWGHYIYSAPNENSFLADATVNPFWRNNDKCSSPNPYYQPYDYVGMWNQSSWNRVLFNKANELGWANLESWGRLLMIGMSTNNGTSIPCWRHLMIGGVGIWLDDWDNPSLDYVGPTPEGWVKKDGKERTFSVSTSDIGLGVRTVRMFGLGTDKWPWNKTWCKGTYEERCPNSASGQITFKTEGFPYEGRYNSEGKERKFTVQAVDPTDETWQIERPLWLDGTPPVVSLAGQLATVTKQEGSVEKDQAVGADELSLPTYQLEVKADDGADRSGVREIKVFLDGSLIPKTEGATCATAGCPRTLNMTYVLRLTDLAPGKHSLRIVAVDLVGNESDPDRNIEFEYIPATGMKEEFVLQHFRLPDGNDYSGEAEYHGPEIAVNVINGNVVFHERDVDLETDRGDLELERVYNSQQPVQADTQWGRGWTIAQTPALELQPNSPPQKATVSETGRITSSVPVPQSPSQSTFSAKLHATITKTASGYEVEPVSESEISVFNGSGRIEEVVQGDNSPAYLTPEEAEWAPSSPPAYKSSFDSAGTVGGRLAHPAGIAVDGAGDLWVVDQDSDRLQKFSAAGAYLTSFGSSGPGNGQFERPTDVAIDAVGHLWVTDAGANRVKKFNAQGELLAAYGSYGTGNGQFSGPESLAIAPSGAIWVADTHNGRLQKFDAAFGFIKVVSSKGSGLGQMLEPAGIDIAPNGDAWVADWSANRVSVFTEAGEFVRRFGSLGTGNGQFGRPGAIEVDHKGRAWVSDQINGRVQQFDQSGDYVTQFGVKGAGSGQFSLSRPMGIASDSKGRLWVSDAGNDRVQRWDLASFLAGGPAPYFDAPAVDYEYAEGRLTSLQLEDEASKGEDPSLDMSLSAGLVSAVESDEAGDTTYAYNAGKLAAVGGQDGQTKYAYDASGRLSSVTLPNGTTATIVYDGTSRAASVTVDPAGSELARTTKFSYAAEPRRTTVWGGGNPEITYDIGEDGSVLKWAYTETPPTIASISGSLWSNRGQEIGNQDHTLFVTGSSPHQVASIKVIANGNSVVAEKTCEDPAEPPSHKCDQPPPLEWITHASEHAPGRMDLEVIVTDFLGHQRAERFFVFVPQQPPPGPEEVERPTFASIKLFREEYGLDRNKSLTEPQRNELILELLYEWEKRDFTAMTAVEEFGVPMRAPELAEMEYRRQYLAQASEVIPQWAEEHAPATYGGYYVDNRAGGVIYVGFTQDQSGQVAALNDSGALMEPAKVEGMPAPPSRSIESVEVTEANVAQFVLNSPTISALTTSISTSTQAGLVEVTASNPEYVRQQLTSQFGASAPILVTEDTTPMTLSRDRFNIKGPVVAGDYLLGNDSHCTANFSAQNQVGVERGQPVYAFYKMTAGHCFNLLESVSRSSRRVEGIVKSVGKVRLSGWSHANSKGYFTDVEMIDVNYQLAGGGIFTGNPDRLLMPNGVAGVRLNREYCWSGFNGNKHCGTAFASSRIKLLPSGKREIVIEVSGASVSGDSGGPVWDNKTKMAVGIVSGHGPSKKIPCHEVARRGSLEPKWCPITSFVPLLPFRGKNSTDGALKAVGDPELRLFS